MLRRALLLRVPARDDRPCPGGACATADCCEPRRCSNSDAAGQFLAPGQGRFPCPAASHVFNPAKFSQHCARGAGRWTRATVDRGRARTARVREINSTRATTRAGRERAREGGGDAMMEWT